MKAPWAGLLLLGGTAIGFAQFCEPYPPAVMVAGDDSVQQCTSLCRSTPLALRIKPERIDSLDQDVLPVINVVPGCGPDSACAPSSEPPDSSYHLDRYSWVHHLEGGDDYWENEMLGQRDSSTVCIRTVAALRYRIISFFASGGGCIPRVYLTWDVYHEDPALQYYEIWRQREGEPAELLLLTSAMHNPEPWVYEVYDDNPPVYEWVTYTLALASSYDHSSPLMQDVIFTEFGAVDPAVGVPSLCSLLGNFPNPFNSDTRIRYTLLRPATVRLAVFDLLGRRVAGFEAGPQTAGAHDLLFSAGDLPSGIYCYRLDAGGTAAPGKMLLLR